MRNLTNNGVGLLGRNITNQSNSLNDGKAIKISNNNEIDVNFITNTTETLSFSDNDLFLVSNPTGDNIKYITGLKIKQGSNNSLVAGTNINFTVSGNNRQINLDTALTGITSINGYNANVLELNNSNQQFLVKDTSVNYSSGDILSIDSNNKLTKTTPTNIISNIVGGNNITRDVNTINLDNVITSITTINGYGFNLTTNSTVNQFLLKDTTVGAFSSGDLLNINSSGKIDNITPTTLFNNLTVSLPLVKSTNNNNISVSTTPTFNIIESGGNGFTIQNTSGNALVKITSSSTDQPKLQYFQGSTLRVFQQYDSGNNKFDFAVKTGAIHLKAYTDTTNTQLILDDDVIELKVGNSGNTATNILTCSFTEINVFKQIDMNSKPIYLRGNGNLNHYIKFDDSTGINGVEISGFGFNNQMVFRLVSQGGGGEIFSCFNDKISFKKPLYMNSTVDNPRPIFLHFNTDFFIKYQNDSSAGSPNVVEIKGFNGVHLGATGNSSVSLKVQQSRIQVSNVPLRMNNNNIELASGSTTDLIQANTNNGVRILGSGASANRVFTVESSAVPTFLIECWDFRLYLYKGKFQIANTSGGQSLNYYADNETIHFHNSNGRLSWQADRNLVIYNTSNNPIFASGTNMPSERRLKDNIVSLNLENSYNIIKQLNPVSFVYKEDPTIPKKGFIVDEIEDKIPECIKEIKNCGKCKDMTSKLLYKEDIVPDLVASVKFLINKVETLEQQLLTQSNLISNLQSQMNYN